MTHEHFYKVRNVIRKFRETGKLPRGITDKKGAVEFCDAIEHYLKHVDVPLSGGIICALEHFGVPAKRVAGEYRFDYKHI